MPATYTTFIKFGAGFPVITNKSLHNQRIFYYRYIAVVALFKIEPDPAPIVMRKSVVRLSFKLDSGFRFNLINFTQVNIKMTPETNKK